LSAPDPLTERILRGAYQVSNTLGAGFLEKVYENALALELRRSNLGVLQQHPVKVQYLGQTVGDFVADLLVEDQVLVELKAVKSLEPIHQAQCINHLKATGLQICLLLNFGTPRLEIQRLINKFN
jgi:GxxExxY protein